MSVLSVDATTFRQAGAACNLMQSVLNDLMMTLDECRAFM